MTIHYLDLQDLADELQELQDRVEMSRDHDLTPELRDEARLDEDEQERYRALTELDDELGGLWSAGRDGGPAIPEYDFQEYAMELAEELGSISPDTTWPATCIDWEHAARDLSMDYSTFTFDGTDYLIRY